MGKRFSDTVPHTGDQDNALLGKILQRLNGVAAADDTDAVLLAKILTQLNGLSGTPGTITPAGTTGAQTINKSTGTVNFAAAATTLVVTNSLVTVNSIIFATVRKGDATATLKNVVPAAGSFTITLTAAATAETSVGFLVVNAA